MWAICSDAPLTSRLAVAPTCHLPPAASPQVTRLDVSGFIALLREVGGPLVSANIAQWGALQLPAEEAGACGGGRAACSWKRWTQRMTSGGVPSIVLNIMCCCGA